ncbi:MAG: divalent-cation tolerance protein CutA [Saprospiraceae bacterium]|nr:divalent-cation tolerance protein CutA [Saprospiraceae bacterium]MCB9319219.1 divalent-cation tolerance protein CutA [Lewinellaceae bacterium]
MEILLAYVTCPSQDVAETLGQALVRERVVACYNAWSMNAAFWWDGDVSREQEWVLLVKTRLDLEQRLEDYVLANHPYQVPCILRWRSRVNVSYGNWIHQETQNA